MGVFRSEIMVNKRIRIPRATAHEIMNELGKLEDTIEFIDLNKDNIETKRNFNEIISRCDDSEKRLARFEKFCSDHNVEIYKYDNYDSFISDLTEDVRARDRKYGSTYFDLIEAELIEDEKKFLELVESSDRIGEKYSELIEKKAVMEKMREMFVAGEIKDLVSYAPSQSYHEMGQASDLSYIAGVCRAEDELRLKRMIFRVGKGRALMTFFNLNQGNNTVNKIKHKNAPPLRKIFLIFLQSGVENYLLTKINKILEVFNVNRYQIPRPDKIPEELKQIQEELAIQISILKEGEGIISNFLLERIGNESVPGRYDLYRLYFNKEKLIYFNLNKCLLRDNFIDGEVWIPKSKFQIVQQTMRNLVRLDEKIIMVSFTDGHNQDAKPPTYFKTNELTWAFQEIVNTYGVPRYNEINPALFSIVTFPFLFGVMFGDIGHGLILFMFAAYLCLYKDQLIATKSVLRPALKARYLLLFMGVFAFFSGWMYNDFLSIPLNLFGSCYENTGVVAVKTNKDCVYPFGMDPKWYVASNELAFFNSLKMKLSVILGVSQMLFGIVLRGVNSIYFKNSLDLIFEFIPQLIFMTLLFGYMIIMIFLKWATDWSNNTQQAPSIINLLMNIFLKLGSVEGKPVWGTASASESLHFFILVVCVICIPIMLIPKPILSYFRSNDDHSAEGYHQLNDQDQDNLHDEEREDNKSVGSTHKQAGHHHESLADLIVHQSIETIEFVLGSISNTASYLRLWALSLAHAQLAKVFFDKSLLGFIQDGNLILIIIGFFIFANVTFAVLMCMDLMECFLHTLRLHWVEFQNKFYKADGYKFTPFSFKQLVNDE